MSGLLGPCIDHGLRGDKAGYGQRRVGRKWALLHRLVYAEEHGLHEPSLSGIVMHQCDNPRCVNPHHLSLGTHRDNALDREAKGRGNHRVGEDVLQAKLTRAQVLRIRERYAPNSRVDGTAALGREFGISQQHVSRIVRGLKWAA